MKACDDCGEKVSRRTKCKHCGLMVCRWCHHHVHALKALHSLKTLAKD